VVERGATGLTPGRMEVKHGIRSSNTAQVILDEALGRPTSSSAASRERGSSSQRGLRLHAP